MTLLDDIAPVPVPIRGEGRPGRYPKGIVSGSTLAGWYGSSYTLVQWAKRTFYDGALEGKTFEELNERDTDIGSLVHSLIEASVHGLEQPTIPDEYAEPVASALSAWQKWMEKNSMTVVATELPLISVEDGLGGTVDAILRDGEGKLCIGDWKTSATLRSSYLVQLAIYGLAWDATNDEKITGGYYLLRFSKVGGRMADLYFPELAKEREFALHLRKAYTMAHEIKKASGFQY